jgi:hypothetical protein
MADTPTPPADGGLAFPVAEDHRIADQLPWTAGMSLRDGFAGQIMAATMGGFMASDARLIDVPDAADGAYKAADALLAARRGEKA